MTGVATCSCINVCSNTKIKNKNNNCGHIPILLQVHIDVPYPSKVLECTFPDFKFRGCKRHISSLSKRSRQISPEDFVINQSFQKTRVFYILKVFTIKISVHKIKQCFRNTNFEIMHFPSPAGYPAFRSGSGNIYFLCLNASCALDS